MSLRNRSCATGRPQARPQPPCATQHHSLSDNRRGSVYSMIEYIIEHSFFRFLFVVASIFAVIFLVRMLIISDFSTTYADKEILVANVLYNPDGFSYADPVTGRAYPGVIDMAKFSPPQYASRRLDAAAYLEGKNTHIAAQFTLKDDKGNVVGDPNDHVTLNKDWFTIKYPIAASDHANDAGLRLYRTTVLVKYIPDPARPAEQKDGTLTADIIVSTY